MTAAPRPQDDLLALAGRLADAAGAVAMRYFRGALAIDAKADASPVTVADREAEMAMRAILEAECPDHGIFGEEHGRARLDAEYVWVLDPIDGTKSFVIGKPLFGNLIALLHLGRPLVGIINCPALNERWVGMTGRPSTLNGKPIKARAGVAPAAAWLATTTPEMFTGADAEAFARLRKGVRHAVYGGDCHSYGLLASGSLDLVAEANMQPYDYMALVPVIEGAGGVVTDWRGAPLSLESDGRVLAAGDAALHAAAGRLLAG
ncbi:histidinol-phosphatase [Shumkonia mesophila]|uniref:histidinol-phosphatase n=1 Tax=Shumkonia mesophila TaxID=2838854 RepID=UPI002934696C|nr:histidinol-phosphatase [Shumkonia mesophila]